MWPQLATAGMGLVGGMMSKPKPYDTSGIMQDYEKQFQDVQDQWNEQVGFGRGLMDYDSDFNKRLKQQFATMSADRLSQQNRQNTANTARFGGLPGMTNAQNSASGVGFAQAGMNAYNQLYGQNMGKGANMVNTGLGALQGIDQQIADTRGNFQIANADMNNQYNSQMGSNLMGFGMNAMMPGIQSWMGGNPFSAGYNTT